MITKQRVRSGDNIVPTIYSPYPKPTREQRVAKLTGEILTALATPGTEPVSALVGLIVELHEQVLALEEAHIRLVRKLNDALGKQNVNVLK